MNMKKKFLPAHANGAIQSRCYAIICLVWMMSLNSLAQDLVKVAPVTNKILMVSLDEGHVDYHDVYGENDQSIAYAKPLNITNAQNKANYLLSSSDDANYTTPKSPLNLGRKAKAQDIVDLYAEPIKAVLDHSIYIELPNNLVRGKTYTLTVNNLVENRNAITFVYDEKRLWSPTVHVNQVGFVPSGVKYAYLSQWMGSFNAGVHVNGGLELDAYAGAQFQVVRASDNAVVFTGTIAKRKDKATAETLNGDFGAGMNFTNADVWECNFTGFTTPGQYYVAVDNMGRSHPFAIEEGAYRNAYNAVSKAIFTQRQGVDKEIEGGVYPRGHHPDDRDVWFTGTTTKVNVWGYYYDAGDWDGHNRHIGVPMDLMLAYDFKPGNFKDGDVGNRYRLSATSAWINEGSDGLPDILNEAKWLVSFYKRAKEALVAAGKGTGGVPGGKLPNQNGVFGEGYIGPDAGVEGKNSWTDTRPVYVNSEQTANTFLYAGAAAYYAVVLNKFNNGTVTTESNTWRTEAINAYNWAEGRLDGKPDDVNDDQTVTRGKILGSACLYRLTGEVKYLNDLKGLLPLDDTYRDDFDAWQRMETWHYAAMIIGMCPSNHPNLDVAFQTTLKNRIIGHADNDFVNPANDRGFRFGFNNYRHTSNGAFSVPRMEMVAFAYEMTGDIKYLQQVQHAANYTLGGNENNMTYVSGLGHNPDEKTFHPDAWQLLDFNSQVYTNPIFPGYSNYYAMKDCDFFGCGFNFSGDEDFSRSLASPAIINWPAGEWRMNNKYSIAGSEFTMEETLAQTAFTYAYLSGSASAAFTPNARPTVALNFTENQAFSKAGCNLTVTASADTRLVKYYYDWHFIGESADRANNFAFFWTPPQASGTTVVVTAVGYDDRGLITRPTDQGDRSLLISSSATCSSTNVAVTAVSLSPATATVAVGATQQLTAAITPANATNKNVTWSTSNAAVASVSNAGLVTGIAAGTATITVTTQDGNKTATSTITVTASPVAVTGVSVAPTTVSTSVGSTQQLTATVSPANATNKNVTWSSSNNSIATVNAAGLVTGVAVGTATITVTTQDGARTATATVMVTQTLNAQIIASTAGASEPGNATVNSYDGNATTRWANDGTLPNAWIEYTLDNTYTLTSINLTMFNGSTRTYPIEISVNGTVAWSGSTALTSGVWARSITATGNKVRIRMTAANSSGTNWFSISEITITGTVASSTVPVASVAVSPVSATLNVGATRTLTATVSPSNATNKNVSWSSSNPAVATVSASGIVTGVAAGSASITVTTQDGAKTALSAITVTSVSAPTPLVRLAFNENTGSGVSNTGSVGGSLAKTAPPNWSGNVPASGGVSALDFGTATGNFAVESGAAITQLGGLSSFTITGWLNNRSATEGSGGNRVVSWINNGGEGVDLVYKADGSLQLGINQWPDGSPAKSSAARITTDAAAAAGNWRFFAITYNASGGTVQFFFGSNAAAATLDVSTSYSRGNVGANVGRLAIGHFNAATRAGAPDRMFRGLVDEVQIYGQALSLSQIQSIQGLSTAGARTGTSVNPETAVNQKAKYQIYPNPWKENALTISVNNLAEDEKLRVSICDVTGRVVCNTYATAKSGSVAVTLTRDKYPLKGLYFIHLSGTSIHKVGKVIVE